jgi:Protein of unknown function (DUF3443)
MALCRHCWTTLQLEEWWCPSCGRKSSYAPKGAARTRPAELPPPPPAAAPAASPDAVSTSGIPVRQAEPDPAWQSAYRRRLGTRRRRRQIRAGVAGTVLALAVAVLVVVLHTGPADVTIPLTFDQSSYGAAFDPPPIVDVTIGRDHTIPVLLDTGSVGLHIFASARSAASWAGVKVSSEHETIQTLDGTLMAGPVASATLQFGSLRTTRPVPFQLITATRCGDNGLRVSCQSGGDEAGLQEDGADGFMGIGLDGPAPGDPVTNPLLSLPGRFGRVWTVDMTNESEGENGELVLGPPPLPHPLVRLPLQSIGSSHGASLWNDEPELCWVIGQYRLCGPTILDSGSSFADIGSPHLYPHAIAESGLPRLLAGNQPVSLSLPGHSGAFWAFDPSGPGPAAVAVADVRWPFLDTGEGAFLAFQIQYDNTSGTITIANPGS